MYALEPFDISDQTSKIKIHAEALKENGELLIHFKIEDPKNVLNSGAVAGPSGRQNELWKTTCFEVFFGVPGQEAYWELNASLSGNWNLYQFESYRNPSPPKEESNVTSISHKKTLEDDHITGLELRIPLQKLSLQNKKLEVSLTSVIEFKSKDKSYYAIKHSGDKPDFHRRESFVCNLV